MREGLRSGNLSAKLQKDKGSPTHVLAQKKEDGIKQKAFDSNDKKSSLDGLGSDEKPLVTSSKQEMEFEQRDGSESEKCGEDVYMDGREYKRKRDRVYGEGNEDDSFEKKKVKGEGLDDKVQTYGRVLRSRIVAKRDSEKKSDKGESGRVMVGKRGRGSDGSEKKMFEVKKEENDQSDNEVRKTMKRKRGRKRRTGSDGSEKKKEENDHSDIEVTNKMKRKRGRPPKVQGSNGVLKVKPNKEIYMGGLMKREEGFRLRDSLKQNVPTSSSFSENKLIGKGRKVKWFAASKKRKCGSMEIEDNEAFPGQRSKTVNAYRFRKNSGKKGGKTKQKKEVGQSKSEAKQLVRDRIVELLLGAGWTIEYRPRNNKEYNDAVYVNPEGRTHWSVTLAYNKLKQCYEADNGDSKTGMSGFTFTPIPEEDISMLTKVITKTRVGKKKLEQERNCEDTADEGVTEKKKLKQRLRTKKLQRGKLNPVSSMGSKSLKGKMKIKRKSLLFERDNSIGASHKGMPTPARNHKPKRKRCALLARSSMEGAESDSDGYILYNRKRTVLAWMIDLGTVPLNGKVQYMNQRTQVMLEGRITRDGIHCDCCSEIFTISKFENHAGSKLNQPFHNIFLETGISLLQCLLDSWNKQDEPERKGFHFIDVGGEDPNDDTCGICGDGGDLICCDGCPSTFHQSCLDIKKFPSGDWHCIYCSCKCCGMVDENTYQRDNIDETAISAVLTCCLCEEKYHRSCVQEKVAINEDPSGPSFCGKKCQELFQRLQVLLGIKHDLEDGFSWTLVRRSDVGSDRSLHEVHQTVECNSKVAVALFIMDECFLPLVDHRSGINLIHNIVYNFGSNFNRLNYSGFFTAILERGDEVISAASIRLHGNHLAEMPFIGTRHMYRRQGMCRRLLSAIESVLSSLNVEKLVIPAISELRETWTSVFGFNPLDASSKQKMRNMNMMVFPGIDMLQKPLLEHQFSEENLVLAEGLKCNELKDCQTVVETENKFDERCSAGFDLNVSSEGAAPHACKRNIEPGAVECSSQLPDGSLNDTSELTSETVNSPESGTNTTGLVQVGVTRDDLGGSDGIIANPLGPVCDAHGRSEEISDNQNAVSGSFVSATDERKAELDAQLNLGNISELESKLHVVSRIGSEATDCGAELPTSREATLSVPPEVKIEDSIIKHSLKSHDEGSMHQSDEIITTQPQDVAPVLRLKVSVENVTHDSNATSLMSCDVEEIKHHDSQQFQVAKRVSDLDKKMLNISEVKNNHAVLQNMSVVPGEVDPASIECFSSQILSKTSNTSSYAVHHNSPSVPERAQEVANGYCPVSSVDSYIHSSGQVNRPDAPGAVSATVNTNTNCDGGIITICDDSIAKPNFQPCMSNGHCISTESVHVQKEASTPWMSTESSKQLGSDSQVDHTSVTQCNSESLCNSSSSPGVALHCASGGGTSCGPEVIILSNQAS